MQPGFTNWQEHQQTITEIHEKLNKQTDAYTGWVDWPVRMEPSLLRDILDTAEEIRAISKFAASLDGVREHHLLPYHRLGQDKYTGLGRSYLLKDIQPPTQEKMQYLLSVAEESGLLCQIGG